MPKPQPLLVLAAPRSFSSVLGAMLGQHPQTYGLPELNLFLGETLGEVWDRLARLFPSAHSGLLRTICELTEGKQTEETVENARGWIKRRYHWPMQKVFDFIQEAVGDRMLVEKGPTVTFSPVNIERMYALYPKANYLHLVRHPRTSGKSVVGLREDFGLSQDGAFRGVGDPEQIWNLCNGNSHRFTQTLPIGQAMRIKGEWIMADPRRYLPQVCEWLEIDSGPEAIEAMLHPEESPFASVGPEGALYGNDPNFLKNPALDWDRLKKISEPSLDGDLEWRPGEQFTRQTLKLAREFGYQ